MHFIFHIDCLKMTSYFASFTAFENKPKNRIIFLFETKSNHLGGQKYNQLSNDASITKEPLYIT